MMGRYRYAVVLSRRIGRALFTPGSLFLFFVFLGATILTYSFKKITMSTTNIPRFEQPPPWVWSYVLKNPDTGTLDGRGAIRDSRLAHVNASKTKLTSKDSVGGILKLLVTVKSAPQNTERRKKIRTNWLNYCTVRKNVWLSDRYPVDSGTFKRQSGGTDVSRHASKTVTFDVTCFFMVGQSKDKKVTQRLSDEQKASGDLRQLDVLDKYDRLTSKTLTILHWSLQHHSDYLLQVDDDTMVFFSNLLPWLATQPRKKFYAGHKMRNRDLSIHDLVWKKSGQELRSQVCLSVSQRHVPTFCQRIRLRVVEGRGYSCSFPRNCPPHHFSWLARKCRRCYGWTSS